MKLRMEDGTWQGEWRFLTNGERRAVQRHIERDLNRRIELTTPPLNRPATWQDLSGPIRPSDLVGATLMTRESLSLSSVQARFASPSSRRWIEWNPRDIRMYRGGETVVAILVGFRDTPPLSAASAQAGS